MNPKGCVCHAKYSTFLVAFAAVGGLLLISACGSDGSVDDAKNAAKDLGTKADNSTTVIKKSARAT